MTHTILDFSFSVQDSKRFEIAGSTVNITQSTCTVHLFTLILSIANHGVRFA